MPDSLASQSARLAAYTRWSREDAREAREAFLGKFLDEVDPDRQLPEDERVRRAECARKAYFTKLAYQSAKSRRGVSKAAKAA